MNIPAPLKIHEACGGAHGCSGYATAQHHDQRQPVRGSSLALPAAGNPHPDLSLGCGF